MTDAEFFAVLSGQVIGVFLSSFVQAAVLKWRVSKVFITINYWPSYLFSLKVNLISVVFAFGFGISIAIAGFDEGSLFFTLIPGLGLLVWMFTHSNMLAKLAQSQSQILLMSKCLRLSGEVLVGSAFILFASSLTILALLYLVFLII